MPFSRGLSTSVLVPTADFIRTSGFSNGLFHLLKIHPHRRVNLDTPSRLQLILQKTLKTLIDFEELPSRHIKIACDPLDAINFGYKYPQDKSSFLLSSQCVRQLDNNLTLCVPFHTPLWYFDPQDR